MLNSSHFGRTAYAAFIIAGISACGPTEEEASIQDSENLTASTFVKNGFKILEKANTLVAAGNNAGFIVNTLLGNPSYAQISQQVIDRIADAVGQRFEETLFRRDGITAESVLGQEASYIRPDCVSNDSCDQFTVTDMRNDARLLDRDSRKVLDQMTAAPGFLSLQAAQHIQRLSMTRIFATHEIGLAALQRESATETDDTNHQENLELEGNLAVRRLNDLEDLLLDFVDRDYSEDIEILTLNSDIINASGVKGCFDNPVGKFCAQFGDGGTRRLARDEARRERQWQIFYNFNQLRDETLGRDFDEARDRMAEYGDGSVTPQAPISYDSCGRLEGNGFLTAGQQLTSCNGRFALLMQGDGNLVIYENGNPQWASNTHGRGGTQALFQRDGNLVIYRSGGRPVWSTGTRNVNVDRKAVSLLLRDNGRLVLRDRYGRQVWRN